MYYWHDGWWPMGGWLWLSWGLLGILLLVILVWILRYGGHEDHRQPPQPPSPPDTPETIVKKRYARGEITREEYERLLEDLRK